LKARKQKPWAPSKRVDLKWGPHFAHSAHSVEPLLQLFRKMWKVRISKKPKHQFKCRHSANRTHGQSV